MRGGRARRDLQREQFAHLMLEIWLRGKAEASCSRSRSVLLSPELTVRLTLSRSQVGKTTTPVTILPMTIPHSSPEPFWLRKMVTFFLRPAPLLSICSSPPSLLRSVFTSVAARGAHKLPKNRVGCQRPGF